MKRTREENDNEEQPQTKKAKIDCNYNIDGEDDGHGVFDISELVENIVKYLLGSPKTIRNLLITCKRTRQYILNASLWQKLGFNALHIDASSPTVAPNIFSHFLSSLQIVKMKRKLLNMQQIMNVLSVESENLTPVEYSPIIERFKRKTSHIWSPFTIPSEDFVTNRRLTKEAVEILLTFKYQLASSMNLLSIDDIIMFMEVSRDELTRLEGSHVLRARSNFLPIALVYYPKNRSGFSNGQNGWDKPFPKFFKLLHAQDDSVEIKVFKTFLDENRSVVFIFMQDIDLGESCSYYIKFNSAENLIEEHGEYSEANYSDLDNLLQIVALPLDLQHSFRYYLHDIDFGLRWFNGSGLKITCNVRFYQ